MLLPFVGSIVLAAEPALPADHPCSVFTDVPEAMLCDTPQSHGRTQEDPLQWGPAAWGASLWRGWLLCPDGRDANTERAGSVGTIPAQEAPANPGALLPSFGGPPEDMIDRWTITCSGQAPVTWYVNGYRCGDPCPPDGLRVTPGPVVRLFRARDTEADSPQAAEALALAADVTQRFPDIEATWFSAYHVHRKQRRFPDALAALTGLEAFRPLTPDESAVRAIMALFTADVDLARAAAAASRVGVTDKEHLRAMTCVDDVADAIQAQTAAPGAGFDGWCEAGIKACCEGKAKKKKGR
jgi:hypothetical protein